MLAPFRGLLFNPRIVGDVAAATSPPYDVISPEDQRRLAAASPYNMVRLLLPEAGRYQDAGRMLQVWRRDEVLVVDPTERLYVYEMTWSDGSRRRVARGVVGALLVEELGGRVLPHEETMSGTRADRYAVLDSTQANLDPIVALSSAPALAELLETTGPVRVDVTDGQRVRHRLFDVEGQDDVHAIRNAVSQGTLSIADGHHRYTTALAYTEEHGPGPWSRIMAMVAPGAGSGLTIAPYHRWFATAADLSSLDAAFDIEAGAAEPPTEPGVVVLVTRSGGHILRPRREALATLAPPLREASTAVARDVLYPLVGLAEDDANYTPDARLAISRAGSTGTTVLVAPVTESAITAASDAGIRFPQKTTFFTPKPRAGLVVRPFRP